MDRILDNRRQELVEILPNLRRFAMSLTGSLADADDLLQSTVERVLSRGAPADAGLLPWCLKVCRNLWIDEVRHRKVQRESGFALLAETDTSVPGDQGLNERRVEEVQEALGTLPGEQRAVLLLVAVEGYAYREAADALGIPVGTVMSRLARARAALADALAGGQRHDAPVK